MAIQRHARLVTLLAIGLIAGACGGDRSGAARQGGTAVVAINTEIDRLNSLVTSDKWASEITRYVTFIPLVQYGPKLEYEPALASSWEMQGDTAAVFHLRRDVKWSDGRPTTAEDVVFTYQRAVEPKTAFPNREYFTYWTGARALDPYTVRFTFQPHADPLAGLPFLPIMPRHALDSIPPEQLRQAAFNQAPITNGPFRFVEHRANDRWVFEANPDYPRALGGRPRLDRLVVRIIPEPTSQVTALLTGEADMVTSAGAKAYKDLANRPGITRIARPTRQIAAVVWNGKRPGLSDPRLRHALSLAIDRQTILDALRGGMGRLATGPIVPQHWAFDAALKPLPYAPDSARAILASLGYRDRNGDGFVEDPAGKPFEIVLKVPASSSFNRNLAEMVQSQFARVGVRLRPESIDAGVFRADIEAPERNFDAAPLVFESDFRILFREQFHSASAGQPMAFASYSNPSVDSIIDQAPRLADKNRARPMWARFQQILLRDQPWTFLYYFPDMVEVRNTLHGTDMDVRGTFVNVTRWWKDPAGGKGA